MMSLMLKHLLLSTRLSLDKRKTVLTWTSEKPYCCSRFRLGEWMSELLLGIRKVSRYLLIHWGAIKPPTGQSPFSQPDKASKQEIKPP